MSSQYVLLKTNSYIIRMNRNDNLCWFHGKLSREQSEKILRDEGKGDGVFLVRESNTSTGDYVLSVMHEGAVVHYQIRRHGEDAFFSIEDHKTIHGLDSLIEHYRETSHGLITPLSAIVKRDPPPNNSRLNGQENLLHRATKCNNFIVVSEMLNSSISYTIDAKNQHGQTAVHLACLHADATLLKELLDRGANVNCRDTEGNTPLHYACRDKPAAMIRLLVESKADFQLRNNQTGCLPIHDACKHGNIEATKELLALNAPHLPRSSLGEFPIDHARDSGHKDIVTLLDNFDPPPATTSEHLWYHGTLDRNETIKILDEFVGKMREKVGTENIQQKMEGSVAESDEIDLHFDGAFIVRFSTKSKGNVLSLLAGGKTRNYIIREGRFQQKQYLYIDEGPYMPSLNHLIQHYMNFSDGLPVNLRHPVKPTPKPPVPLFSTIPRKPKSVISSPTGHNDIANIVPQLRSNGRTQTDDARTERNKSEPAFFDRSRNPHRNLSIPSDDLMNKCGLYDTEESKNAIFRSLKMPSPKKKILDGMLSLKKKKKPKKLTTSEKNQQLEETALAELAKIKFSPDFQIQQDTLYNIPTNAPLSVGATAAEDIRLGDSNHNTMETDQSEPHANAHQLNDAENNPFIASDSGHMAQHDMPEEIYFIDAPPAQQVFSGYIPFVNIPMFTDHANNNRPTAAVPTTPTSPPVLRQSSSTDRFTLTTSVTSDFFTQRDSASSTMDNGMKRPQPSYFIPATCLVLDDVLGTGEFGSVYSGSFKLCNEYGDLVHEKRVAIKTLHDEHCQQNRTEFLREASVMIQLQHHCIVRLIGISKGPPLMMVQELVQLGSMLDYLLDHPDKVNPNHELKLWASQIACGMSYLEANHYVHRDLAARNILLSSRNQAKISDFGLSRALLTNTHYQATQGGKWPIKWYAFESFEYGTFSHASDVWSFGVTLWEMFSMGEPPYGEMKGVDVIALIKSGQRLVQPQLCPDNVYSIMENCWNFNPKDRPTFKQLTELFANDPDYQNLTELIKTTHIG